MQVATTHEPIELAMTYSAYKEIEQVPRGAVDAVSRAILALAEDPHPAEALNIEGASGCYWLPVGAWYVLYHLSNGLDCLTVLGVLDGPHHTLH